MLTQKEAENIIHNHLHQLNTHKLLEWAVFAQDFSAYLNMLGASGNKTVYVTHSITHYGVISYGSQSFSHEYDIVYPLDEIAQDARGSGSTFTAAIIANHFKPEIVTSQIDNIKFAAYMAIIRKNSGPNFYTELRIEAGEYRKREGEIEHLHIVEDPRRSIFISFSSFDVDISDKVYKLLLKIGIRKENIFYTNMPGYVGSADDFAKVIKENIFAKPLVLLLNSNNYKNSQMCNIELGAAWVIDSKIFPLLSPVLQGFNVLPNIIATRNGCNLSIDNRVLWLINVVRNFIGLPSIGDELDVIDAGYREIIKNFAQENRISKETQNHQPKHVKQ